MKREYFAPALLLLILLVLTVRYQDATRQLQALRFQLLQLSETTGRAAPEYELGRIVALIWMRLNLLRTDGGTAVDRHTMKSIAAANVRKSIIKQDLNSTTHQKEELIKYAKLALEKCEASLKSLSAEFQELEVTGLASSTALGVYESGIQAAPGPRTLLHRYLAKLSKRTLSEVENLRYDMETLRNTILVELHSLTGRPVVELQAISNADLIQLKF
eukprot:m.399984 g.399984  ORF g.399984 m.399984 type:complete len:217 (-) comp56439_c0_seq1:1150-1800(-)